MCALQREDSAEADALTIAVTESGEAKPDNVVQWREETYCKKWCYGVVLEEGIQPWQVPKSGVSVRWCMVTDVSMPVLEYSASARVQCQCYITVLL